MDFSAYQFGYVYAKTATTFTVYATNAAVLYVALYKDAKNFQYKAYQMTKIEEDVWSVTIEGDLENSYYEYIIKRGKWRLKTSDPFAFSCSANGKRSCVVDIAKFKRGEKTNMHPYGGIDSAILYETHIRDFTVKTGDTVKNKGKYLGVIEGSADDDRLSYLHNLGVSHIHFLPLQDFASVDEASDGYNWGYDPHNYFIPEGLYSTDFNDPYRRIVEMCQMVDHLHQMGLGVVLDVVYNHTYESTWHPLEILAPNVYYRKTASGYFSNGSGCGNELNSEHPAVRHLIIESLKHWQNFYGFDGFRFDLMALIDTKTMQYVAETLRQSNPKVILYGEPWMAQGTTLDPALHFTKGRQQGTSIAVFNDDYRKLLKGDSDDASVGFIQGDTSQIQHVLTHMIGAIDYSDRHKGFTADPHESINYITAHDNLILYDKLKKSTNWQDEDILRASKLAFAMITLAFGVPFIQAGTELMHSKKMDHNSYKSGDDINAISWHERHRHAVLYNWLKRLLDFRKHMDFYQNYSAVDIQQNVLFEEHAKVVIMQIKHKVTSSYTLVLINGSLANETIHLEIQDDVIMRLNSSENIIEFDDGLTLEPQQVIVLQQQDSFI